MFTIDDLWHWELAVICGVTPNTLFDWDGQAQARLHLTTEEVAYRLIVLG
jgi:hypothetical protein